jgi:hypothetical protein
MMCCAVCEERQQCSELQRGAERHTDGASSCDADKTTAWLCDVGGSGPGRSACRKLCREGVAVGIGARSLLTRLVNGQGERGRSMVSLSESREGALAIEYRRE